MKSQLLVVHKPTLAVVLVSLLAASVLVSAQGSKASVRPEDQTLTIADQFSAVAANITPTARIRIVVNRWTTDAERAPMLPLFGDADPNKAVENLRDLPKAGQMWTPESVGYLIRFAHHITLPTGGERIILVTDRPVTLWGVSHPPKTTEPQYTVIELRVNAAGLGDGKTSLSTKFVVDDANKTVALDNYAAAPVALRLVKRDRRVG